MSFNLEDSQWDNTHSGERIPPLPAVEGFNCYSYVRQSEHGNNSVVCNDGAMAKAIIDTWDLNNPGNLVPPGYYWKGIHDDSILAYVIPAMQ